MVMSIATVLAIYQFAGNHSDTIETNMFVKVHIVQMGFHFLLYLIGPWLHRTHLFSSSDLFNNLRSSPVENNTETWPLHCLFEQDTSAASPADDGVSDTLVFASKDTGVSDTPVGASDTDVSDTPVGASDTGVSNTPVGASDTGVWL